MRLIFILTSTCFIGLSLQGRILFPDEDQSTRLYRKLNNFYHKLFKNSVSSEETINNEINDSSFVKFKDVKSAEIVEPITTRAEETTISSISSKEETDDSILTKTKAIKDSNLARWQGEENSESENAENENDFYPETEIMKILENQGDKFIHLFSNETKKDVESIEKIEPIARTAVSDWKNLCETTVHYTRPRIAKNKDGVSMFVVNFNGTDPKLSQYQQQVRITKCIGDLGESDGMCGAMSNVDVVTKCQQEYTDHKLVALDPSGKELVVDTFIFPSCCTCVYSNLLWE